MEFVSTADYHRNNPDVSLSDYYRKLRIELASSIKDKKKIYLDTKFWVLLRNGSMNPSIHKREYYLLQLALRLVENGSCIFPISEDVFLEVTRQTDEDTLLHTVKLIDLLSQGVSILSYDERIKFEILHFWYSHLGKETYSPQEMVWTKLSYTMGFGSFTHDGISESDNLIIQKSFTDKMWSISLTEQIELMISNSAFQGLPEPPTAEKINKGKFAHTHEASSYKQMFMNELAGWIDFYGEVIFDITEKLYMRITGNKIPENITSSERDQTKREMCNMIYNLFRLDKMKSYLPSARINSGLYAAVRWDKKQKFQDHDFHDFRHASAALPYFDYFFTEKRLTHLVTQNQTKFDQMFDCKICSKVDQAIKLLESIR